jgi:hypothetical protein
MAGKIYEYAVLFHPKYKKDDLPKRSEIVVDVTRVIAEKPEEVTMVAARSIPEAYLDKLDQVEIAVRPF